jgi:hypothetical protein
VTWLPATDLLATGSADLDAQLKLAGERLGTASLAVAASAVLEGYAWTLARPLDAAVAAGEAPADLTAGNVLVRFADGFAAEVATGDAPALAPAAAAARMVDGHLAVLVARLAERRVRRGPRALWGLVANACAAAAIEEAQAAGHPPQRTAELVNAVFGAAGWPLPPPPLLPVTTGGRECLVRRRVTCCLHYTLANEPCATCPLLSAKETRQRMSART